MHIAKQLGVVAVASSVLVSGVVLAKEKYKYEVEVEEKEESWFSFEDSDWVEGLYALGGVAYGRLDNATLESDQNISVDVFTGGENHSLGLAKENSTKPNGNIGWRAGFGSWLTRHFGVEFNYYGIASMDSTNNREKAFDTGNPDLGTVVVGDDNQLNVDTMFAFDLTGSTRFFFTESLYGFGRLGLGYSNVERSLVSSVSASCSGASTEVSPCVGEGSSASITDDYSETSSELGLAAAIGLQWDITPVWGVRIEGNTIQTTDNNADMYMGTANVVMNFGEWM